MFDVWIIDSYVIILVGMKPVCWGLTGNQGTMVTYASIYFSTIELICYVWWLSYRLVCNHFGWNKISVLEIERKSRYHGYICTYKLPNGWSDMIMDMTEWWVHIESFWLKWKPCSVDWKKENQGTMIANESWWSQ